MVLRLLLDLGENFKLETTELCFGFYMTTNSDRFQQEKFEIGIPVMLNAG